jgi:hypothetical protein
MAVISRPVSIGLAAAVAFGLYYYFQDDTPPVAAAKPKVAKKEVKRDDTPPDFVPEDFVKRFDRAKPADRNIFKVPPGIGKKLVVNQNTLDHVPSELADGDGNWIFTGVASMDGAKMALLENSNTHQGAYVKEGELWKASRIQRISGDGVALSPKAGGDELVVYRHKASLVAEATPPPGGSPATLPPAGPIQPMSPPQLSGPIGGNVIIRRGRRGGVVFSSVGD